MSYLIDTNVISELRKKGKCNPSVAAWFSGILDDDLFLSVLTIGELRKGIEKIRGRDPKQASTLNMWLRALSQSFGERILTIDSRVADQWGRLPLRDSLPVVDALIGATALTHGLTVATRNVKDISRTGAVCLNPFES